MITTSELKARVEKEVGTEICPVFFQKAENCILFLWVTFPNLEIGLETIRRWGFKYKTAAFVWVKRNKKSPVASQGTKEGEAYE